MTFDEEAQTLGGVSARQAGTRLAELGVAAVGANHGAGPASALAALAEMQRDGLVLAALPNVGLASLAGPRVVYPHATPEYFAEFAAQARKLGAGVIGGCCGTTPARDRGDPRRGRREPAAVRAAHRRRATPDDRARRRAARDRAAAAAARRTSSSSRSSSTRRSAATTARCSRRRARSASRARRTSSTSTTTRARGRA